MADLTPLQQDELDALCGDRAACLRVVSGLRGYRALVQRLVGARYRDGFVEAYSVPNDVEEIEGGDLPAPGSAAKENS
jgi:hypothetical protein